MIPDCKKLIVQTRVSDQSCTAPAPLWPSSPPQPCPPPFPLPQGSWHTPSSHWPDSDGKQTASTWGLKVTGLWLLTRSLLFSKKIIYLLEWQIDETYMGENIVLFPSSQQLPQLPLPFRALVAVRAAEKHGHHQGPRFQSSVENNWPWMCVCRKTNFSTLIPLDCEMSTAKDKLYHSIEDMDVSLHLRAAHMGSTLQTYVTLKWLNIFDSFFLHMKIWDINDCFAVGFMNFHQIVIRWEHFDVEFSKICFQHKVKILFFGKMSKGQIFR